jgi:hypothetical protein
MLFLCCLTPEYLIRKIKKNPERLELNESNGVAVYAVDVDLEVNVDRLFM